MVIPWMMGKEYFPSVRSRARSARREPRRTEVRITKTRKCRPEEEGKGLRRRSNGGKREGGGRYVPSAKDLFCAYFTDCKLI